MHGHFSTRCAEEKDALAIEKLEEELFQDNNLSQRSILQELRVCKCYVIEHITDDFTRVVAYTIVRAGQSLADILRIGVCPSYQSIGLGTNLLNTALLLAPETMLTVRKTNERAIALYGRKGFRIVGELTHGLAPGWVMQRSHRP